MSEWMPHEGLTADMRERLNLWALDLLGPEEAASLSLHLAAGCPGCDSELKRITDSAATVALDIPLVKPPDSLRARVLASIKPKDVEVVRSGEGRWKQLAPGVSACRLHYNRERGEITSLLRIEAGASYAPHRHTGPEQCYVLEGEVFDDRNRFGAGDYEYIAAGTTHGAQRTEHGCLLLIISSVHDEFLE